MLVEHGRETLEQSAKRVIRVGTASSHGRRRSKRLNTYARPRAECHSLNVGLIGIWGIVGPRVVMRARIMIG